MIENTILSWELLNLWLVSAEETICDAKHWLLGQKCGQKFHFTPKCSPDVSSLSGGGGLRLFYFRSDHLKVPTPSPPIDIVDTSLCTKRLQSRRVFPLLFSFEYQIEQPIRDHVATMTTFRVTKRNNHTSKLVFWQQLKVTPSNHHFRRSDVHHIDNGSLLYVKLLPKRNIDQYISKT